MTNPVEICIYVLEAHYAREVSRLKDVQNNLKKLNKSELDEAWYQLSQKCDDSQKAVMVFFQWLQAKLDEGFIYLD